MSAPRVNECKDEHLADATRRGSALERRGGKPSEAGDAKAGAEEFFVKERTGYKVYERSGLDDGLLRQYLLHGEGLHAALSA